MTILYFTATGNNLYIAKRLGGKLISIPQAIRDGCYEFSDDKIGIVFPIYGVAVPQFISEFLYKAKFNSNYIFAILSYGMMSGAATEHLHQIGKQNGIEFAYINKVIMVDNWLLGYYMEKQIANEHKKQIETQLDGISRDINASKQWVANSSMIEKFATKMFSKYGHFAIGEGVTKKFAVESSCNGCGTCVKVCPLNNIKIENHKPMFENRCMSCLACTQNCPQNALRLNGERSRMRFRNKNITLGEIIEANK